MFKRRSRGQAGFTYIEMMVTATVLVILASIAVPMYRWDNKRRKEVRLRITLQQMRDAIDLYKKYTDEGRILLEDVDQMGYPPDLETLIEGVTVSDPLFNQGSAGNVGAGTRVDDSFGETTEGKVLKFLLREPIDPITGEATWGMRSYQDDWDSDSWGGENLYDVYSLSDKKALDGTYYRDW